MTTHTRDKAYYDRTTIGSHTSGRLAEAAVDRNFNLQEPYVEVKSCNRRHYRVVVKKSQIDRWPDKTYAIVVYDRKRNDIRRKGVGTSIEEAFAGRLVFLFVTGSELLHLAQTHDFPLRVVTSKKTDLETYRYYFMRIETIRNYLWQKHRVCRERNGHDVYGTVPSSVPQSLLFPEMYD